MMMYLNHSKFNEMIRSKSVDLHACDEECSKVIIKMKDGNIYEREVMEDKSLSSISHFNLPFKKTKKSV